MRLQVRYRVSRHVNNKPRPPWFSRRVALASLLAALEPVRATHPVQISYIANRGVPDEVEDLVSGSGDVQSIEARSAPQAYRRMLDVVPGDLGVDDLVWLAEDDYLYRPDALSALVEAAQALPHVDYFGLYTPDNSAWHAARRSQPDRRGPARRFVVGGRTWVTAGASNATFGVRAGALREDARALQLCSLAGSGWDHACLCVVQGVAPYPARHLAADLPSPSSTQGAVRYLAQPLLRGAVDVAARTRRHRRTWIATTEDLATHMESGYVSSDYDWSAYAAALAARG